MITQHGTVRGRRRRTPATVCAALLAAAALVLAACGSSGGGGSETDAGQDGSTGNAPRSLDKVTFLNILPMTSLSFAPYMVAQTGGYFEKNGLEVSNQTTKGSAQAIQTVIAGKALLTWVGGIETMIAANKGAPVINIGTRSASNIRFVSAESNPLTKAADFKDELIGLPSEGGTSEITLDLVLSTVDVKPDEAKTQVVGLAPGVYELVKSGRIGAYAVSLDTSILLKEQRSDAVVYDPNEAVSAGNNVFITSKDNANNAEKKDQLTRYMKAINQATKFIINDEKNDFKKTIELITSKYDVDIIEKNKKAAIDALKEYVDSFSLQGVDKMLWTDPATWQKSYDELVKVGLVKSGLNPKDWLSNEFSPNAS